MSDRSEFNDRTDRILRNDIRLAEIQRTLRSLYATVDHEDFGISTHEVIHACNVVEKMKTRTGNLLAALHPGGSSDA